MTHVLVVVERSSRNAVEQMHNMNFNEAQVTAIRHVDGPMMVIAGPGSGKTTVITQRIKYLIESAGVSPADILVITFTRAAAAEMQQRFRKLTPGKDYPVRFGTFHSIFYWILKTAYGASMPQVVSEEEKRAVLEQLLHTMELSYENKDDILNSILSQISLVKCDMMDVENYYSRDMPELTFREIYRRLESEWKRRHRIDFDDMMVLCYELFVNRPDILERCRGLFPYILIDEFQDSNRIQYEIFRMLANPKQNAFIVGDDDQSVYGFRGARPEIMQQFQKDFPSCKKVYLGENYRSDYRIVQASTQVIEKNKTRYKKTLVASASEPGIVQMHTVKDEIEENECIIRRIRSQYQSGVPYEQQAVLYRTNLQPRRLAYKLNQYNIPYTMSDVLPNLFDHFAVRYALDYMRIAAGDFSRAVFLRILNKPSRYISRDLLLEDPVDYDKLRFRLRNKEKMVENLDKLMADVKLLRGMRPWAALNFIRNFIGYDAYIKEYAEYRQLDAGEMYDVLDEFSYMIKELESYEALFAFIEDYRNLLARQQEKNQIKKGVNLMTMHSAKGLEFDVVYVLDTVEEMVPYKKAKTTAELEEERRMFYVAMTRAKHELHMYVPKTIAGKAKDKSRFLEDITWQADIKK